MPVLPPLLLESPRGGRPGGGLERTPVIILTKQKKHQLEYVIIYIECVVLSITGSKR